MTRLRMVPIFAIALTLLLASTAQAGVIITEIDYNQPSTDTAEWVELHNPDAVPQSLVGLELVLVNGATCAEYGRYDLDAITIPAGGYVVVGNDPCADPSVTLPASNAIQNGPSDSVVIEDRNSGATIDELEYDSPGPLGVCRTIFTPEADSDVAGMSLQLCPGQGWVSGIFSPCAANLACDPVSSEDSSWGTLKTHF